MGAWDYAKKEYISKDLPEGFPTEKQVVAAEYDDSDGHSGSAYVVYKKNRKLFVWADSHCSCNGLEWGTGGVETTWKTIAAGTWGSSAFQELVQSRLRKSAG